MEPNPSGEELLVRAALQLTGTERIAFLNGACLDNPSLRERLDTIIAAQDNNGAHINPLQPAYSHTTGLGYPGDPRDETVGQEIGRYRLLEKIGEGGCGVVYVAEQTEPVRRQVALKVIKLGMDTMAVVARFSAERQALAMMDHPNIARVFDAGSTEKGRPYFVMELVKGVRITDYCDQHKLSVTARLELFTKVCQAIQHAHQKGIIHRDIKPSNILVTTHDDAPVPKVIDFGIAKATEGRLSGATVFTQAEHIIGTPAYMSPEQADLSGIDIDTRSDIYSLGVVLYELLAGSPPFDPRELARGGPYALRHVIREVEPPRPSARLSSLSPSEQGDIAKRRETTALHLAKSIRGELDWIVMKCLEKDRARRYETANGLAMELQRHLKNEPINAGPPSHVYRWKKLLRRHRLVISAATTTFVALVVGLGVATKMYFREREEVKTRRAVATLLEDALQNTQPPAGTDWDTRLVELILEQTATKVERQLSDQPELQAELLNTIGESYMSYGLFTNASAIHREALARRQAIYGENHALVAESYYNLSGALEALGGANLTQAESNALAAVTVRESVLGHDHVETGDALDHLAGVMRNRGRSRDAEIREREALAVYRKVSGQQSTDAASGLSNLGMILKQEGKWAESEEMYREAFEIFTKKGQGATPGSVNILAEWAGALQEQGKLSEAEDRFALATRVCEQVYSKNNRELALALQHLASIKCLLGKYQEAVDIQTASLEIYQKSLGDPRQIAWSYARQAFVLYLAGQNAEAEKAEAEAVQRGSVVTRQTLSDTYLRLRCAAQLQEAWSAIKKFSGPSDNSVLPATLPGTFPTGKLTCPGLPDGSIPMPDSPHAKPTARYEFPGAGRTLVQPAVTPFPVLHCPTHHRILFSDGSLRPDM